MVRERIEPPSVHTTAPPNVTIQPPQGQDDKCKEIFGDVLSSSASSPDACEFTFTDPKFGGLKQIVSDHLLPALVRILQMRQQLEQAQSATSKFYQKQEPPQEIRRSLEEMRRNLQEFMRFCDSCCRQIDSALAIDKQPEEEADETPEADTSRLARWIEKLFPPEA